MNMKCGYLTAMIVFFLVALHVPSAQALGIAKIVVKVMDEAGSPVDNAHLNIRFSGDSGTVKGFTDDNGIFEEKALSNDGVILGDITKNGYYESGIAHSFYVTKFGMWQPWGKELTVVMRPIVNPVPMYVRNKSFKLPALGREVGFDLEKFDWLIPYGLGTQADFIFKVVQSFDNMNNYDATMILTFSNSFDGIQVIKDDGGGDFNVGSWFRLPRTAPDTGYLPKMQKRISRGSYGRHSDIEDDNNYIFRVRSEVDEYGKLERAMYGKIRGELRHFVGDGGGIKMHYYLNPDYTPNLEFDPKRNLFIILSGSENVTHP
jgi:hypothetical protein